VFGIFIHDGSDKTSASVHIAVTSLTYPPGENVQFSSYGQLPSVDERRVTFLGRANGASFSNEVGVYQAYYNGVSIPSVDKLADRGSSGLDTGNDMADPDGAGFDTAAFTASFVGSEGDINGIFAKYGGQLYKIADGETMIPGTETPFYNFNRRPSMDGSTVFFYGSNASNQGGLYSSGYPFSTLTAVVNPSDKAPGGNAEFRGFQSLSLGGNRVAFYGETTAGRGIYTATLGGGLTKIVDQNDFALIEPMAATNGGRVAFVGGPGNVGLYLYDNGSRQLITDSFSSLDEKKISLIRMGPQGLSGYSLAFWVRLVDHSQAIYRADKISNTAYHQGNALSVAISEEEMLAGRAFTWNLALIGDDLGLARPLWVAPEYASAYLCRVSGSQVFSVTPPEEVDPENLYEVVVFDPDSGEMLGEPVRVPGGARLDFRELGHEEGVRSFAIRGASLDPDYRGRMPLGLIFSRENSHPNVSVSRCAEDLEKCGER
jgi:hypothetical protein